MQTLAKIKELYNNYLQADRDLSKNTTYQKKGGLFGSVLRGIKDTTIEEEFTKEVKKTLAEFCKEDEMQSAGNSEVATRINANAESNAIFSFMITAQDELIRDDRCYYMFVSLHSLAANLIPFLSPEDALTHKESYAMKEEAYAAYPFYRDILKQLDQQSRK
jgi:hypothetical protein